jgi:hypothetical protein
VSDIDNSQKPRIIKTELGDGTSTVLPYGVSVDVSAATDKLRNQLKRLTPMGVPVGPKPSDTPLPPDPPDPRAAKTIDKKAKTADDEEADADDEERAPDPPKPPARQHARRSRK